MDDAALAEYGVKSCYISAEVNWVTDWICLAWPGFASKEKSTRNGSGRLAGLNAKGLTVLTHEGLQGKIGTLSIWPRHTPDKHGDGFAFIIDDFDALSMMRREGALELLSKQAIGDDDFLDDCLDGICPGLLSEESYLEREFFFVPIRCGVNGVVWNRDNLPGFSLGPRYGCIRDMLMSGTLSPSDVGFYDNMGATLPLLMLMMDGGEQLSIADLYAHANEKDAKSSADAVCRSLHELVMRASSSFHLFTRAKDLAIALHTGKIKIALGGGRWLVQPKLQNSLPLDFGLPQDQGGLLWVEGAAITNTKASRNHADHIVEFLVKHLLNDSYQRELGSQTSYYAASPVTSLAIDDFLSPDATRPIDLETQTIYKDGSRLKSGLCHRRCPIHPSVWINAWNQIVWECCNRKYSHSGKQVLANARGD